MINEKEVRRSLDIFKPNNELVEIRVIGQKKGEIYSGYYTNPDDIIRDIKQHEDKNIYFIFNGIKELCYSKQQRDKLIYGGDATKDSDISYRSWILIDIDTNRGGNKVSSSDEELELARIKANQVRDFLRDIGFSYPVIVLSGSGFHLYYKCKLANTDENTQLIKDLLEYLSMIFSDDKVEIDRVVFNAGRVSRLGGTVNHKGSNTKERPHRESRIIRVPEVIKDVDKSLIEKVAAMLPKKEKPTYQNNYGKDSFDIDSFIAKHGIGIEREVRLSDGTRKILLKECPFNSSHQSPDSCIIVRPDNCIGFKCLHNSDSNKGWREFRSFFEPDAYSRNFNNNNQRRNIPFINQKEEVKPQEETQEKGAVWQDFCDIQMDNRDAIVSIPSGIKKLDEETVGFDKGTVTVWSGGNGSAKSTLLNMIALNAVDKGFVGGIWSGELAGKKLKRWLYLQAAGRQFNKPSTLGNDYYTPSHVQEKIGAWLKGKLKNYNNKYSNKFELIMEEIKKEHEKEKFDFIILDNLMALNILTYDGDKNEKQSQCIKDIHNLAIDLDIVIHIVMHARKPNGFIRKTDISGSADLSNMADNVFIVHRVNDDFVRDATTFWGDKKVSELRLYTNVVECVKQREFGTAEGMVIGLFYEVESKRLLNEKFENIVYSWQETYSDQTIEFSNPFTNDYASIYGNPDFLSENGDECPF